MSEQSFELSRRALLGTATLGTLGALVVGTASAAPAGATATERRGETVAFHGPHQAGIATPAQAHLSLATFDLADGVTRAQLRSMLNDWSRAAELLTQGQSAPGPNGPDIAPADPGEALDLGASGLTVTLGVGRKFLRAIGDNPECLPILPAFAGDQLDPARSDGALCIQACANDAQAAFHAVHVLSRLGLGTVTLRVIQNGFLPDPGHGATPRNLTGFKDGSRNVNVDDVAQMHASVWSTGVGLPVWMQGGTYLVARRIRVRMERWAETALAEQEASVGRRRYSGAPLSGTAERDRPDFSALDNQGRLVIPASAHVRLAAPEQNDGARMLRRGYSYVDGIDQRTGELDAGKVFIAYMADPMRQFVAVQTKLPASDALHDYLVHTASAVFAVPRGLSPGQGWGTQLLA